MPQQIKDDSLTSLNENKSKQNYDIVERFETYEDYLDSQLTQADRDYLEDEDVARQLVELGLRGIGETIRREDFISRKKHLLEQMQIKSIAPKELASYNKDFHNSQFLEALASREELIRSGKLTCIVFIRDHNSKQQEISGYIDLAHRMKTEDFNPIFESKKKLLPKPSDLSYFNWETQLCSNNSSPFYQVSADSLLGIQFKNKRDRKVINVNPEVFPGENTTRVELENLNGEYLQVTFYDHLTRRKM